MSTQNIPSLAQSAPAPRDRALTLLREALEQQKLCDDSVDVDAAIEFAIAHPTESVVDSFASAEILSALDEVFGSALPKEILNHKALSTLDGLRRSVAVLEARKGKKPSGRGN
jgi:hypothetical protein